MGQVALLQTCETCHRMEATTLDPADDSAGRCPGMCTVQPVHVNGVWDDLCSSGYEDQTDLGDGGPTTRTKKGAGRPLLSSKAHARTSQPLPDPGTEALMAAAQFGSLQAVRRVLQQGVDVRSVDSKGWTALHWAAQEGHMDVCGELLRRRADAQAEDNEGRTPLAAAREEDVAFAAKLTALALETGNLPVGTLPPPVLAAM
mmetsp:Transcript_38554/g.99631  ORF Transcript_38554/g.99631 Transcript_38554/m.99631 type:complete len:202 (-) Transcript_38554:73-678(-)